jgi:hypothetical protein
VHSKATLFGPWTAIPNTSCIKHIAQMLDGPFVVLAGNGTLMTAASLGDPYVLVPNLDPTLVVQSITVPAAGGC